MHVTTSTPDVIEDAERAFWRLTQETLRRQPEALEEDTALLDNTLLDGLAED